jgi:hypothetical protein
MAPVETSAMFFADSVDDNGGSIVVVRHWLRHRWL